MSGFDPRSPNLARVYDAVLGGKDNFEPDRDLAAELTGIAPQIGDIVARHRRFQVRAVTWLANQGITQFLDLGCGLPAAPNIHEIAQTVSPDAAVAYVDRDPVVVNHMTTFARPGSGVTAVRADAADPGATRAALAGAIDFTRPAAVLMCALLHFYDLAAAREIVAGHASGLAPGSYLVVTVIGGGTEVTDLMIRAYRASGIDDPMYTYTAAEVADLLGPFELVPPGVTHQDTWRPAWPQEPGTVPPIPGHVAVARVPAP